MGRAAGDGKVGGQRAHTPFGSRAGVVLGAAAKYGVLRGLPQVSSYNARLDLGR